MTLLPLEIYELIISHMAMGDVARVARCSKSLYATACRHLYRHAKLRFHSGAPDKATKPLLLQLARRSELRHCVRHFSLSTMASTFWTAGHSALVGIALSAVLEFPDRIRTFRWDASGVFTGATFMNLESLQCSKIRGSAEIQWVQWHLATCRNLKLLRLGLVGLPLPQVGSYLFSSVRSRQLQIVTLQRIDLTGVAADGLLSSSTKALQLRHCPGSGEFLARACRADLAKQLQELVLVGDIDVGVVVKFVRHLSHALQRLALCLGGVIYLPCLQCVAPSSPNLRSLILDFRVSIISPDGTWMYPAASLAKLVRTYPKLEVLGLPLNLGDAAKRIYTRTQLPVFDAQSSRLHTIHLRRKCVDWRSAARDAKHVARAFRGGRTFNVFMGYSASLRKLTFEKDKQGLSTHETSAYGSIAPAERQGLVVDVETHCTLA